MKQILKYLKPYTTFLSFIFILVFLQTLSELYLPTLMSEIVDQGIVTGDVQQILKIGGIMLLVAAAGMGCALISGYFSSQTGTGFAKILRTQIFTHVESFSLHEFNQFGTASLITRTTNDISQLQMVIMIILRMFISAPFMCLGATLMAITKDTKLSLIFLVALPIIIATIAIIFLKSKPLFQAMQTKLDTLNRILLEGLTGMRVIRAFNRIEHEQQRFNAANLDLTNTAIKINQIMAGLMPMVMLVMNFTAIAIIWFGGIRINNGQMQLGNLMAFLQYIMQIMFSLVMLSMMFVMLPRAMASATRISEVLALEPQIKDAPLTKSEQAQRGYLEFQNVSFTYPSAAEPVLTNLSFQANPGEVTAIIGGTGSGKSTLVNLIPRFYDLTQGKILLDGLDLREMTQAELRAKIGYVPQKTVLFKGSILENLRYGKEDATLAELEHATEVAQASEFIATMKDGLETMLAQGGTNLSGGQKQRLAIARALVRQPEIYIFDDSFSALDFKTDAKLRAALKDETSAATVLIVAQRVNTVMDADRILVLEEGQIVGIGRHQELLKTCPIYHEIVTSQFAKEEIA